MTVKESVHSTSKARVFMVTPPNAVRADDTAVSGFRHQHGGAAFLSFDADAGLSFRINFPGKTAAESPITVVRRRLDYFFQTMPDRTSNVIQFPVHRRRGIRGCPHCGSQSDVWQIGRLLWGYCKRHEVRWVVANYASTTRATINRRELCKGLEFLSSFAEVSH